MANHITVFFIATLAINLINPSKIDKLRESVTNEEQRAYIKISVLLDRSPRVVSAELQTAIPEGHLSQSTVYNLYGDFNDGKRTDISDLPKPGRPRTATSEENKETIKQLILESDGMRTEDIIYETGLSQASLYRLLKEIGARKIKSRWVPHELTPRQMQSRMNIAGKHLARYQRESGFLDKIISIDETWVKTYDPEDPKSSSEWLLPGQKALVETKIFFQFYKIYFITGFFLYMR